MLVGNRTPLHAPDWNVKGNFILHKNLFTFSSKFLCLKAIIPLTVPKERVCPSALHPEHIIFSLNLSFGISFLPGMYSAKSAAPPLNISWVRGLKLRVRIASLWDSLRKGYIFFYA